MESETQFVDLTGANEEPQVSSGVANRSSSETKQPGETEMGEIIDLTTPTASTAEADNEMIVVVVESEAQAATDGVHAASTTASTTDSSGSTLTAAEAPVQSNSSNPTSATDSPTNNNLTSLPNDITHILQLGVADPDPPESTTDYAQLVKDLKAKVMQSRNPNKAKNFNTAITVDDDSSMREEGEEREEELAQVENEMKEQGVERDEPEQGSNATQVNAAADESSEAEEEAGEESSSEESSSDDDSSSSSSDSEPTQTTRRQPNRQKHRQVMIDSDQSDLSDSEDPNPSGSSKKVPKTEHELDEDTSVPSLPEIESLPETVDIVRFGVVQNLIENVVVIRADTTGSYRVLDQGTIVCWEDRKIAGTIFDTFGSVLQPFYSLRFPATSPPDPATFTASRPLCYAPTSAHFVFTRELQAQKGSDASNVWDEEVGEGEIEFSDDEAEQEYKRAMKSEKKGKKKGNASVGGAKASTLGSSLDGFKSLPQKPSGPLPEIDEEGPYNLVQRPKGLHLMGTAPPSGPEGRQMFERDTGRTVEGEKEFEFSDNDEEDGGVVKNEGGSEEGGDRHDDEEMDDAKQAELARIMAGPPGRGGKRGRGRGEGGGGRGHDRSSRGGGGRGRGAPNEGRGRGRGRGRGAHNPLSRSDRPPQPGGGDGDDQRRQVALLPNRAPMGLPMRPMVMGEFGAPSPMGLPQNFAFGLPTNHHLPAPPQQQMFNFAPQAPMMPSSPIPGMYNPYFQPQPTGPYPNLPGLSYAHPQPSFTPDFGAGAQGAYNPQFFAYGPPPLNAMMGGSGQGSKGAGMMMGTGPYGYVPPPPQGQGPGGPGAGRGRGRGRGA
ncbi:BQ5605_C001g00935 [Microbotryum silenes-dioicae]|uniref:H/ACA ribonucleoprotein complex non-core subunit NAF1 n=1 Tax=Microbotryum silenes-dioicae TaxID=796604 RepID=A0A2X0P765_9BASI|nr:BQ5605_C001g00935 [Microbotryum silenes-dioicae]